METYRDENNELIATIKNGSCNLGSVNINAFIREPFTDSAYFDYDRFDKVVSEMTWGLDELLTMLGDRHALPEQVQHVFEWREVGLTY